ncbi:hypothetical protein [Elizabethkingia meningoseptica]|uniref:hypothetical protein n=1 Tax=Elizabethkingia meningoseptica TaxID=238 RepID=UPI0023AFB220|nr:hypothetical protein [Elizabethkingia meningoseptica]
MMYQEYLLKEIRKKIGTQSLNDEIANILNISYDAAHRRSSMKAKSALTKLWSSQNIIRFRWISLSGLSISLL